MELSVTERFDDCNTLTDVLTTFSMYTRESSQVVRTTNTISLAMIIGPILTLGYIQNVWLTYFFNVTI